MSDQEPLKPRSLGEAFSDMLRKSDAESSGKPFYDKTLNYLYANTMRAQANAQKLRGRIEKMNVELNDLWQERDTGQSVFIREYNKRQVVDPSTGEAIPNPFDQDDDEIPEIPHEKFNPTTGEYGTGSA